MNVSKRVTAKSWTDPDDAPDLSSPKWKKKLAAVPVKRGRPKLEVTKVSTTIRLDADVLAKFRAQGPKWQSRMNDALRAWLKSA
jgi:uncharacterized protein (DUF4415 family)